MLKGIPQIISPELLKVLCEMGHGDRLVIADGNYPAQSMGKNSIVIRCDGHGVPELLSAILKLFPLDPYTANPATLMKVPEDANVQTPIWEQYKDIISMNDSRGAGTIGFIDNISFYEQSKTAYAIIATGEKALYANIMLQKGVVTE